jgi:hypothetical protein
MFSIDFILDYEDGIDSDDILGKIELTAQIESIGEDYTYIDSWFWVLIDGIGTLKKNNSYIGDLIEEPEPLKMYKKGCEIILSYKSDKIILNNIQDLEIAVKKAGQNLINIYRNENNFNNNLFLKKIEKYCTTGK